MFSIASFFKQVKIFIFSIVLVSSIFVPQMMHSTVRAAEPQDHGVVLVRNKKFEGRNFPVVREIRSEDETVSIPPITSYSASRTQNLRPEEWRSWEIVPSLSPNALSIYERGLAAGNNPHGFSKIGDGEISAAWFLTDFDLGSESYDLGTNTDVQSAIDYFAGSFGRQGFASRRGFNVQRVLDSALADPEFCLPNETPLDCEIRIHQPSFALISMGTNQVWQPEEFELGMRAIIETLMEQGVVPVLSTKADNLEGNDRINMILARLAAEYDIPLWNFWRAVQPLPNHGLQKDYEHLTYHPNDFADPYAMQFAWPIRNLSALQLLGQLMRDTQP